MDHFKKPSSGHLVHTAGVVTPGPVGAAVHPPAGHFVSKIRRKTQVTVFTSFYTENIYRVSKKKPGLVIQGFKDPLKHNCTFQYF